MATVWSARDDVLGRTVAVKLLHDHLARDDQFVQRFRREALAAARLAHPNIVAIYDSGSQPGDDAEEHFIVMEYCSGGTLDSLKSERGVLSPDAAMPIGITVCDALAYAHRAGIVHRDIKPANVLMSADGTVKVGDFGIAKAAFTGSDITTTGSILGTVTYLAPEQLDGREPDARSDIYSLGVVLYELLAGRPPFVAESQLATALKHQREAPAPLRSLRVGIPKAVEAVVMRALEKDPARRFASAEEMRSALERQSGASTQVFRSSDTTRSQQVAEAPSPTPRPGPRFLLPLLVLLALGVGAILTLPLLVEDRGGPADEAPRSRRNGDTATLRPIEVRNASDFDPYGGDGEHPEEAHLAIDDDAGTSWRTSTYESSLEALGKPGVGLLFDLGSDRDVERIRLRTDTPGYALEIRAGPNVPDDESSLEVVTRAGEVRPSSVLQAQGAGRYWLVWITSLPGGGGGSAQVAEVEFFGS